MDGLCTCQLPFVAVSLFAACLRAEPHEICGEDNFSNVVWKMTPAGETAAVRCPPNAMGEPSSTLKVTSTQIYRLKKLLSVLSAGLILRRCALDEEGIAYWENPTYMKCISNDYRSIQTLVRHSSVALKTQCELFVRDISVMSLPLRHGSTCPKRSVAWWEMEFQR